MAPDQPRGVERGQGRGKRVLAQVHVVVPDCGRCHIQGCASSPFCEGECENENEASVDPHGPRGSLHETGRPDEAFQNPKDGSWQEGAEAEARRDCICSSSAIERNDVEY